MITKQIYVVMASEGEWSDRFTWPEIAFLDEEKAKKYVEEESKKFREMYNKYDYHELRTFYVSSSVVELIDD